MSDLQALKASVLEDGKVDADEVAQLEAALYADGKIDQEEAEILFEINDKVSGADNAPEWGALFVKAISAFVLEDEKSPGVVDAEEAEFLKAKIHSDGQVDEVEKALLQNLKDKATGDIPGSLDFLFKTYLS